MYVKPSMVRRRPTALRKFYFLESAGGRLRPKAPPDPPLRLYGYIISAREFPLNYLEGPQKV